MVTERTVEIQTQPIRFSEDDACERIGGQPLAKAKSIVSNIESIDVELRYKPFYAFDVTLTKRIFRGEDAVSEGRIVVDAMTNIARPFTKEEIEEITETVCEGCVISPQVSEEDAVMTANSRRMQVEHREQKQVDMNETLQLVYKPVWLVELANGEVWVVDGVDGKVYSDALLR